ncbi:nicotinate phosphoribosyltransferase [Fictibacillus macauensis ZFHKF-1]|uniref:Nicotinate phosphoribosyltransferase n=1 Tax=Fictibacillus macauensis ZFHKF-1 TaxID=1196324 RepID=I8IY75_9BACL|nr:nicotinate phosphoribosyltransferase [Fictibacillus macauensis]EIT84431.1 nicotinate phosphoribosyltransferase [Fictibacillus macauensis ZFHKF-1]
MRRNEDLTLHTDKYQINMMYAHWKNGTANKRCVFEAFYRKNPFGNGYAVFAGLERIVYYLQQLKFTDADINYLRQQEEQYDEGFLQELHAFRFTGNLACVEEGTIVFPREPLIRVEARIFEAHLIETALLNFMNYQTLIATKAARIKQVAPEDYFLEFGTRRAQESDAAIWGARAAYLAGFDATSNLLSGKYFDIPTKGTHAHSWVQSFESEEEAFRMFTEALPDQSTLLVDTYDTLKSGIPNAIKIGLELKKKGKALKGIRLDSGDLAYLSIKARAMLDEAGLTDTVIVASNDLDEDVISELKSQGARINVWGVGTQLITSAEQPALGGVYKLVAREEDGVYVPTIKISGNVEKVTTPGFKTVYRIINQESGKAEADYIAMEDEMLPEKDLYLFDPVDTYKSKTIHSFKAQKLLISIFENGKLVYKLPHVEEIKVHFKQQKQLFWPEHMRKLNPQTYFVDLSEQVWSTKMELLKAASFKQKK